MIAVFGDYIQDVYIYGKMSRISPESPIPVFDREKKVACDGGAGNVFANLRALGNDVIFHYMKDSTQYSIKTRYVCDNHIIFRSDDEKIIPYYGPFDFNLTGVNYCILSDYGKGYLDRSQKFVDYCKSKGCKVIVDPKKALHNYQNADVIKLNKKELVEYSEGYSFNELREKYNIGAIVTTLGEGGVWISSDEFEGRIEAEQHQVSDVTGAGDVFIAAMTHFLNKGFSLYESCQKACKLASISVTKFGTYILTDEDIKQTKTIFTNGCFDILHKGHIQYLQESRKLGAKLIVGLNSDESIKRIKGSDRPINNQEDRKAVLESLGCVDEVIIFDDDTPYELIKQIKPDIITKGGDYITHEVVGHELAEVVIIPFVDGYSTTNMIGRIK